MNSILIFGILNLFLLIAITIGIFVLVYFIIKRAVKNGILEAYNEIHKNQ
ncbi:DUF6019 family protein [Clostridium boliviensis]|uniref:DUF6019 family protein n=1 Tax=Clostridium boliviensis TaxID=318465 RepID=A0ABU4GSC3_9CLOT|nr:DUF6019 family protein [Clostridium boliviensis]MDW2800506.1 DUF6019 family protein [Clostridium boliviensis]